MSYRRCWGSDTIPPTFSNTNREPCPFCAGVYRIRNDGAIPNHRMRYPETVSAMAAAVASVEVEIQRGREPGARSRWCW